MGRDIEQRRSPSRRVDNVECLRDKARHLDGVGDMTDQATAGQVLQGSREPGRQNHTGLEEIRERHLVEHRRMGQSAPMRHRQLGDHRGHQGPSGKDVRRQPGIDEQGRRHEPGVREEGTQCERMRENVARKPVGDVLRIDRQAQALHHMGDELDALPS